MKPISVVLIDDDEVIRKGLKETIPWKSIGFTVIGEANNGKTGLEVISSLKPGLVVLDIKMQGMDGLEVSKIIRETYPDTKVILLSGYSDFEYARRAIKEGVLEYILKPVYRPDFIEILKAIKNKISEENEKKAREIVMAFKAEMGESAAIDELLLRIINEENSRDAIKKLELMGVDMNFESPAVALIEMDILRVEYKNEYRTYLQNKAKPFGIIFQVRDSALGLLFSWKNRFVIDKVFIEAAKELPFAITIGVGKKSTTLEVIRVSFSQAYIALKHKFHMGKGRIIYYNDNMAFSRVYNTSSKAEYYIFRALLDKSKTDLERSVDKFFSDMNENGALEPRIVLDAVVRLLVNLEKRVVESKGIETIHGAGDRSIPDEVTSQGTLSDVKTYVKEFVEDMASYIWSEDEATGKRIINAAIMYMEKEYQTATLSSVAERVFITPNHLSFLFKVETGSTFLDKLTEIRINKAKELLKSLRYKTYEVAQQVGYSDARYFSQVFKKHTGVLPGDYQS